jgi:hypothetical protein
VGSRGGKIYALDASAGSLIWSYSTGWNVESSPAVADGRVYVGSDDGRVYAFGSTTAGPNYTVTFTESGLPPGLEWWVDLNGNNFSSPSNVITFSEPNGTYAYSTGALGYTTSSSTGFVSVNGANTNVQVVFTIIPEFPSLFIPALFMMATLLVATSQKKKKTSNDL